MENAGVIYARLMDLLSQMVRMGLIHCDFNEFNILVSRTYAVTIIDFPQMVSIQHTNAQELFERDVQCVMRFFRKKLNIEIDDDDRPVWAELVADARAHDSDTLDATLAASGFNHKDEAALRAALDAPARDDDDEDSNDEDSGDEDGADEDGADGDGGGASRESYCASGNESEVSSVDAAALPGDVAGLPGDGAGLPGDVAALPGDAAPALPADRSSAQTSGSRNGIVQPDLAHLGLADLPASSADVVTPAARAAPAARDVPAARESVLLTDPEEEIGDEEQTAGVRAPLLFAALMTGAWRAARAAGGCVGPRSFTVCLAADASERTAVALLCLQVPIVLHVRLESIFGGFVAPVYLLRQCICGVHRLAAGDTLSAQQSRLRGAD